MLLTKNQSVHLIIQLQWNKYLGQHSSFHCFYGQYVCCHELNHGTIGGETKWFDT